MGCLQLVRCQSSEWTAGHQKNPHWGATCFFWCPHDSLLWWLALSHWLLFEPSFHHYEELFMASVSLTETKGNYYARFYDPSRSQKTKTKTLRTKQKSVARQRLTELEKKHAMGLFDPWEEDLPQEGVTVDQAVEQFLEAKRNEGCREKTVSNYEYLLGDFAESLPASSHVDRVESQEIRNYLDDEELAQTSRDTYYRQLRTFFRWCDEESIVESNPITDVKRPGTPDKDKSFLTPERLEHLIDTIREDVDERQKWIQEGEVVWLIDVILSSSPSRQA